jgi:hypothetical protein
MYTAEESEFPPAIPRWLSPYQILPANDKLPLVMFLPQICHRVECVADIGKVPSKYCKATGCMLLGRGRSRRLLLGLEVVEQDAALLGLLTPVLDNDARAVDDLAGVALAVDLACDSRTVRKVVLT